MFWKTLRPILEEIWANGHQVLFYAEGKWGPHLETFRELPAGSIIYHCDQDDILEVHRVLGDKFCISGGIPNYLLGLGTEQEVRDYCKKVIDGVAKDGGYIMDANAIIQNDAKVENIRAMTDFTREYGQY
jgi:uroporphyrinogen-III decarboxylase